MTQFDSFKRKVEYRSYAIENSWKKQPASKENTPQGKAASGASDYDRLSALLEENLLAASSARDLYEYEQHIYSTRKVIGRFLVFMKKAVRKLLVWTLGWYFIPLLRHQSFVNGKLINAVSLEREIRHHSLIPLQEAVNSSRAAVDSLQNTVNSSQAAVDSLQNTVNSLQNTVSSLLDAVSSLQGDYNSSKDTIRSLQSAADELKEQLEKRNRQILSLEAENSRLTARLNRIENTPVDDDDFYHDFEERFRGPRDEIIMRLSEYIPIVRQSIPDFDASRFVDLGSGRGEWLDILRANGARDYIGVDLNDVQNNICRQAGHNVICGDCIEYLSGLEDGSVDMISGFQLIEHLYMSDIISLLKQSMRVLRKGGIILFETTNPDNIVVGADTFYLDPSHRRPLNPELMKFIACWVGFADARIIPANTHECARSLECSSDDEYLVELTRQFNDVKWTLYGPQDYALLAVKG